ncbi:carbohydrate esterase family 1 and carbohydrate-binding module family 1 protein [Mycena olivaceomarginata]|nr:carbohydrate esterase family 1 and carbohydrate-binding module family 1 protein [Mycena olivaceomarginata]
MAHLARTLFASILFFLWSAGLVSGLTSSFGSNPTNIGMFVYKPTTVKTNPAVIVTVHYCTGTGDAAYFNNSPYAQFSNTYGFIVIYPSSPNDGICWDVSSKATLTHNGGGASFVVGFGCEGDEYHGTADTAFLPQNLGEEIKQWAGIFGYNAAAQTQVLQNTPLAGYTKSIYGPDLQGISAASVGHTVPVQGDEDMKWFGFEAGGAAPPKSTGGATTTTSSTTIIKTTPPTTTVSTPTSTPTGVAQEWGQS